VTPLLEVRDLKKHFPIRKGVFSQVSGHVYAVDGVSFHIERGETLGLLRIALRAGCISPVPLTEGASWGAGAH
jgi:ABC-type microcin C transport system duplicated ATPase subunit YejF